MLAAAESVFLLWHLLPVSVTDMNLDLLFLWCPIDKSISRRLKSHLKILMVILPRIAVAIIVANGSLLVLEER